MEHQNRRQMVTYYKCRECAHIYYAPIPCPKCKSKKFKKYRHKERRIITK